MLLSFVYVFLLAQDIVALRPLSSFSQVKRHNTFLCEKMKQKIDDELSNKCYTSLLLCVAYDGGRFTGWSAANKPNNSLNAGFVRSVEGVLRNNLCKLFGDVDPLNIVLEGCSRTDKGVHSLGMIVQAYCLAQDWETRNMKSSISGKRLPHPTGPNDDTCFLPFRLSPERLQIVLNRMLPDDITICGVCPSPPLQEGLRPFHPTMDALSKTYQYRFSLGPIHDPTQWRRTWHIYDPKFEVSPQMETLCTLLCGTKDFRAFRGTARGRDDKTRQTRESTICTLYNVTLTPINVMTTTTVTATTIPELQTYQFTFTGNRFLYKMVRYLVGSFVAVGSGELSCQDIENALQNGYFSTKKPPCAPAHGLVLKEVKFQKNIDWVTNRKIQ
jgi:tRNA pseudouridine38-40 synthase